ncbi:hypothetical protein K501DRAFT_254586 [Backusella circina FSU 941]|nr:hypothetical protein K501DRAFT_254586 [Backusella circina FSU 941]
MIQLLGIIGRKVKLLSRCTVPPLVFYLLTANDGIKGTRSESPDWLLVLISLVELTLPLVYNPGGTMLDSAVCALLAVVLGFCMLFYVQDRHAAPNGKKVKPFYDILTRWNEKSPRNRSRGETNDTEKAPTLSEMRKNGCWFLLSGLSYTCLYFIVFTVLNTFIQICNEPPATAQHIPYLYLMFTSWIPLETSIYFFWLGTTMSFIIASSTLIHLLINATILNILLWLPGVSNGIRTRFHDDLGHFIQQPPLFDKPWLSRNLTELWSKRWQQAFRPGFVRLGYTPGRRLFAGKKNKSLGVLCGVFGAFLCSGLLHDYIMLAAVGGIRRFRPQDVIVGSQTMFFILQTVGSAVCTVFPFRLPTWLSRTLCVLWIFYTGPLFVEPYVRSKLYLFAVVPGNTHVLDSLIGPICPYGTRSY